VDSNTFDTLTKRLVTRRAGAGLALAGLLGLAVPDADAKKKKKKCKPKCGLCETCKKGKCKSLNGLKQCGSGCIAGDQCCTNGAPGCPAGRPCNGGTCQSCMSNNSPCTPGTTEQDCCTGICINNRCGCFKPNHACAADRQCCSNSCVNNVCSCLPPGGLCDAVGECCSGICSVGVCK
jgi:hypothetical protein